MDYFEFYELPRQFDLDEKALKRKYLQMSKRFHPDFHSLSSIEEQEEALEKSTLNNKAYKVLKAFDSRLRYILELHGLLQEGQNTTLPQAFLMEMMEINESIMELQFDFDAQVYQTILDELQAFEKKLKENIEQATQAYDLAQNKDNQLLEPVLDYHYKRKYLVRIKENLKKIEETA